MSGLLIKTISKPGIMSLIYNVCEANVEYVEVNLNILNLAVSEATLDIAICSDVENYLSVTPKDEDYIEKNHRISNRCSYRNHHIVMGYMECLFIKTDRPCVVRVSGVEKIRFKS